MRVVPTEPRQNPFAPPGVMVDKQAVPTGIVEGPDGAYSRSPDERQVLRIRG